MKMEKGTSNNHKEIEIEKDTLRNEIYDQFPYGIAEYEVGYSYHNSKVLYLNKEAKRIYEFAQKGYSFMYEKDGQKMDRLRYRVAKTGKPQAFCCRLGNENGKIIWISGICSKIVNCEGKEVLQSIFTDATSRMKILDMNNKNKDEILQILTNAHLQYWEYDITKSCIYLGKIFEYGNSDISIIDNFPDKYVHDGYLHPDDAQAYLEHIKEIQKGKKYIEWEARLRDSKTDLWVWNKISYMVTGEEDGIPVHAIGVAENITDKKNLEQKIGRINKQNGIFCWEYDSIHKKIINNSDFTEALGDTLGYTEKEIENVPEKIIQNKMVFVEDVDTYRKMYERLNKGEKLIAESIRLWNLKELEYVWYHLIFTVQGEIGTKECEVFCTCQDISSLKKEEQRYQEQIMYHKEIASSVVAVSRVNLSQNIVEETKVGNKALSKNEIREKTDFKEGLSKFMDMIYISDEDNQNLSTQKLLQLYKSGTEQMTYDFSARLLPEKQMVRIRTEIRMLERPDKEDVVAYFYHQNITEEFCRSCFVNQYVEDNADFAGLLFKETGYFYLYSSQNNGKKVYMEYDQLTQVYMKMYAQLEVYDQVKELLAIENVVGKLEKEKTYKIQVQFKDIHGGIRHKEMVFTYGNKEAGIITVICLDVEKNVQELTKYNEELEVAKRETEKAKQEKHDFLSRISHEIRTPMNVIMGITSLVEKDLDNHEAIKDYISKIDISSRHLLNLINDVWDMARIESGEFVLNPVSVRFEEIEEQIDSMILPLFKSKRVQLIKNLIPSHMPVLLDKERFTQIFFNLLSNAVNFTPEEGKIYVDYRYHELGRRQVCDVEIEHAGVGMNDEYQKNMFEPFKMQENQDDSNVLQGANGLGMSLAKAVVESMGGTLTVNNKLGQGTIFHVHIVLPLADEQQENVETEQQQYEEHFLKGKRILLVEDHPLNQTIAVRLLKNMGANVVTANDGQQSVDIFDDSINDYFDAILMDIRMPVMDGLTASKIIRSMKREDAKRIPIIAMTANAYDADKEKSYEAGMTAHLSKPIEPKLLYQTLQNALIKVSEEQESEIVDDK